MKFDPISKKIYTDNNEFIKSMNCPYKISWDELEILSSTARKCSACDHLIIDTDGISDQELSLLVRQNPGTCLKIDVNQKNLKIVSDGLLEQKK